MRAWVSQAASFLVATGRDDHNRGMQTCLTVTLNGEDRSLDGPLSVAALLALLGLDLRKVAVERNAAIVPRSL